MHTIDTINEEFEIFIGIVDVYNQNNRVKSDVLSNFNELAAPLMNSLTARNC